MFWGLTDEPEENSCSWCLHGPHIERGEKCLWCDCPARTIEDVKVLTEKLRADIQANKERHL